MVSIDSLAQSIILAHARPADRFGQPHWNGASSKCIIELRLIARGREPRQGAVHDGERGEGELVARRRSRGRGLRGARSGKAEPYRTAGAVGAGRCPASWFGSVKAWRTSMRVFAIGDLHLEGGSGKTMDRFGEKWVGHDLKIFSAWEATVRQDDLVILAGDITWATKLEDAIPDLTRIGKMNGRKLMIKGNHDYWWETKAKLKRVLDESITPLQTEAVILNRIAVAGTRGWVCPGDEFFAEHDQKIYEREVGRLKLALNSLAARAAEFDHLIAVLHYPPVNSKNEPSGFTELMDEYNVQCCIYGHLHGEATESALTGVRGNTTYYLVSADYIDFRPREIFLGTDAKDR
jgi:predicted phosphohydrolase